VAAQDLRSVLDAMPADRREAGPLLRVLPDLHDGSGLPILRRWLADSAHWTVRAAAAASLADYAAAADSGSAIDALLSALADPSPHVATVAAQALVGLRASASRSAHTRDGLEPRVWAEWIREHPERPTAAAALLPGLVGSTHESLVIEWATGTFAPTVSRSLAWPALALVATPEADSLLSEGLLGTRREAYVAAAALAQRLVNLPADAALRSILIPVVSRRLAVWGPHAPGSDVRGVLRLMQELAEGSPVQARELLATAARHPHAEIRALAVRLGAPVASVPHAPRRSVNWSQLASAGARPCLVFTTTRGSFTVELHTEAAPLAVSALIEWVGAGTYDGLTFHRVESDFILQSGDFDNANGYGGPARGLRSEFSQLRFAPGVLGIASFAKDTEGSQFFITHNHAPSLDGRYSAVGRVIAGQDVADDVALGDPLVSVSPFARDADTTPDERSMRCTSEHT
jgi:cyclophilin family peptidyl-prolyl cis-trans isomerase